MLLAGILKAPRLVLTDDEARALAEATVNVQRHYPQFQAAQKTIDWVNLGTIAVLTYGTRIMASSADKKAARDQQRELQEAGNVSVLHPQG